MVVKNGPVKNTDTVECFRNPTFTSFDASGCASHYITMVLHFWKNASQVGGLPDLFNQQDAC